jgi:alpha-D-xyloside xylohydrolase
VALALCPRFAGGPGFVNLGLGVPAAAHTPSRVLIERFLRRTISTAAKSQNNPHHQTDSYRLLFLLTSTVSQCITLLAMRAPSHLFYLTCCFFLAILLTPPSARAQSSSETLQSAALKLEITPQPYSYRLIEKYTGDTLLTETGALSFTETRYTAHAADHFTQHQNCLRAALHLDGTSTPAQASFCFITPEILQVKLAFNNGIRTPISEEFIDQGEHYYGIWEMPLTGNLDNRGADSDFLGMRRHENINYSSARAPFYLTSRKYGLYVETVGPGHFTIAKAGKTRFIFTDNELKYNIVYGPTYASVLSRYNSLAGPAFMPPLWAFDSIWWRDDQHDDLRRAKNAQEKVIDDADHLQALHLPASAIWLDRPYGSGEMGWGNMDFDSSFPDPPAMIRDLKSRGINLLLWIANRSWNQLFVEGSARHYLYYGAGSAADMKSPYAYAWFKNQLNEYVRIGVKGYKIDRGEEDELPLADENLNAILFPQMAAAGLSEAYGSDFFTFSRNANDTARKYTAIWNGDTHSTFPSLADSLKTALRSGAINFPMWGSDIGGYTGRPDKELFARWLEFSAFSPIMEVLIGPNRTIWDDYDNDMVNIACTHVNAHHDLIPYTRSYLYQSTLTGMPVMRALVFSYPDDPNVTDMWDEYLYGNELLVAPVLTAGATQRAIYLPAGRWLDYSERHTIYKGNQTITINATLAQIPLFVGEGAIMPRGDIVKDNNNWVRNWKPQLRIEFFPAENAPSSFAYYTGSSVQQITAHRMNNTLNIQFGALEASGVIEVYLKSVNIVTRNGQKLRKGKDYQFDPAANKLTVPFDGAIANILTIDPASSLFASNGSP